MLFIVTKATLDQREKALLDSATKDDAILLCQNGSYLLSQCSGTTAPVMAVAADCLARGVETKDKCTLTYTQWVEMSEQHKQWVTL